MSADSVNRLPVPPPNDPLPLLEQWVADAITRGARRNPTAMTLATVDASGKPSARIVLLKQFSVERGYAVFYTNYGSRKARELDATGVAAAVLHWDSVGRQVRLEGQTVRAPDAESDAYFRGRPWRSQLNAWTSEQSQPIAAPELLEQRARARAHELGLPDPAHADPAQVPAAVPRPKFWGGYRLWFAAVELWLEGSDRFHDRLRYERALVRDDERDFRTGVWKHQWLQP